VHRLRRKAQEAAGQPLPLLTLRGQGYLFASQS
jgi:two-component system response regulator PhoP